MIKSCLFLVFLSLFHVIWSVSAIESAYREDRATKFFCAVLAGESVLNHCSCRQRNKKVNVKMITSETKSSKKSDKPLPLKGFVVTKNEVKFFHTFVLSQHFYANPGHSDLRKIAVFR